MTSPSLTPEPPVKIYRLYLPAPLRILMPAILVLFTVLGILMVAGALPGADARRFGIFWLAVVGIFWFKVLTIPHRIEVLADGRSAFVSLLRRIQVSPMAIESIKPAGNQIGFFILRHREGRILLIGQFDGFHEFLSNLKASNPNVELRGC